MKKTTRKGIKSLLTLALTCLASVGTAWADVPFTPTTIVDGDFAAGTKWYTMAIGSASLQISDNNGAECISLTGGLLTYDDADLWCFVGDDTNGYRIYNKKQGAGKALTAPTTMSASDNGGTSYAILKDTTATTGYTNLWDIKSATATSNGSTLGVENGYYFNEHGLTANILNNRNGKFAFWSEGYDTGSAIVINFAQTTYNVNMTTGTASKTGFFKTWTSTATDPQLTIGTTYNNMYASTNVSGAIEYYSGQYSPSTYSITAGSSYEIKSFSFKFKKGATYTDNVTITAGDTTYTVTDEVQTVAVDSVNAISATFIVGGANKSVLFSDFTVTVGAVTMEMEPQYDVFITQPSTVPYRIPAIAQAKNGNLIAVADYRYSGGDIGTGKIDLRYAISKDNGATWTDAQTLVSCNDYTDKTRGDNLHTGFGDPCIVADRESNRVLVLSCSGDIMFTSATRDHHQGIARFYSEDGGETWSAPTDISETIYTMFDASTVGTPKSMFVGSGRIFQSATTKVGDYYRIYCSVLYKDENGTNKNYVLYSDDFGGTWSALGGVDAPAIPSGADEPKTEELPDGSILCSSRMYGGRYYNIFHFTNSATAEGSWGSMATSNASNKGTAAEGNTCNGEVLIIPAKRKADGKKLYIMLQSVPLGSGRANVGIYYKELVSYADFSTPANLAKNWTGKHQASYISSAYSTMTFQQDNHIGFLYEEDTHGKSYTIVYKNYSLEQITDSLYEYCPEAVNVADSITSNGLGDYIDTFQGSKNVGGFSEESVASIKEAYAQYESAPSKEAYQNIFAVISQLSRNALSTEIMYRLRNYGRSNGTMYLTAGTSALSVKALDESDQNQLFYFIATSKEGVYNFASKNLGIYVGAAPKLYAFFPVTTSAASAEGFKVSVNDNGLCAIISQNPTNASYPALHLSGESNLVPWTTTAEPSLWYIEATDVTTDIAAIEATDAPAAVSYYDIQGRRLNAAPAKGIYITSDKKKRIASK